MRTVHHPSVLPLRGKCTNTGKWRYGAFITSNTIVDDEHPRVFLSDGEREFEIIPKTFGEMVDELSEDGEPYYTGDIFRVKDEPRQTYHYDVFLTYDAERMFYGFMKCKREAAGGCIQSFIEHGPILSGFKRIGNIHDNPELHDHNIDEVSA